MKKLLAIILCAALVLTFAACGSASTDAGSETESTWTPCQEGKLTIGTSADFAPYEFHVLQDGKDTIVGFDIALAQDIADELGLELEIKDISFDNILMELSANTIDLAIAGFSPDPERAEVADFSDIYYKGGQSFVILASNADKYSSYADFKGLQVAAQTGTIQADLLAENCPDAQAVLLANMNDIVLELETGKIEGAFIETIVAENYIKSYPDLQIMCDVEYDEQGSVVCVGKGNTTLLETVNKVIAADIADGSIDQYVTDATNLSSQSIS